MERDLDARRAPYVARESIYTTCKHGWADIVRSLARGCMRLALILIVLIGSGRLAMSQRYGGFPPHDPSYREGRSPGFGQRPSFGGELPPGRWESGRFPERTPAIENKMEFDEDGFAVLAQYQSTHIALRTDLPEEDAEALLERLESLLTSLSGYWGRRPSGVFTCYVAQDVTQWPPSIVETMDLDGLSQMQIGAGYCSFLTVTRGSSFRSKAVVYSAANEGVVQHELVHAFCSHSFGRLGPLWYSEGMAEGGQYWGSGEPGVQADIQAIRYLRRSPNVSIADIVEFEGIGAWQDYKNWWSLCYFLDQHPTYSEAFRELGRNIMTDRSSTFNRSFSSVGDQLTLEYQLFRQNIEQGYQVQLCTLDFEKRAYELSDNRMFSAVILADNGWQPVGLRVTPDQSIQYVAQGGWTLEHDAEMLDAEGDEVGRGRLVGMILTGDFQLSQELSLGASGSFTPPVEGRLFVRCRDSWGSLADNEGELTTYWRLTLEEEPVVEVAAASEQPSS